MKKYYHNLSILALLISYSSMLLQSLLLVILLAQQMDSSEIYTPNETNMECIDADSVNTKRHLHQIELTDLPDILPESCALVGIPPYPLQLDLESILIELSKIFQDEPTVFIGQYLHWSVTTNNGSSDYRSKVSWKNGDNQLHSSNKHSQSNHLAFYERERKDRTCLLTPPKTTFYAVPYAGQLKLEILVQFINENCHVFRTPRGTLTSEGLFHQHMLSNLYSPKHSGESCIELYHMPTKVEFFSEYLLRSRPLVIKNGFKNSPTMRKWTMNYLNELYGQKHIHIKLTEDGVFEGVENAQLWSEYHKDHIPDQVKSKLKFPDLVVVRPATSEMLFSNFIDLISSGNLTYSAYLEYSSIPYYMPELVNDIHDLPFLDGELKRKHLNMWLSDGNTLGKLHFDPYDNFLCQLSGEKHLTLFDPHHNENLYESHIPEAILTFDSSTNQFFRKTLLESTSMVMSPVDIQDPDLKRFPNFSKASHVNCVLQPGDVLFMPAFWWHEVQSYPDPKEKRNLAINFWYEPLFSKEFPCEDCRLYFNMLYKHLLYNPPM